VRARTPDGWSEFHAAEVILAAGAIATPAILLRSGIGPARHLRDLEIAIVQEAPVGYNLAEHPDAALTLQLQPHARATSADARLTNCCVRYSSGLAGAGRNDMVIMSHNLWALGAAGSNAGNLLASVYQPYSRGEVRLASPDADVYPEIAFRLLSDERDLVRMIDGVRRMIAITQHPAVSAICESVVIDDEGRTLDTLGDDPAVAAWLLSVVTSTQHAAGTCRMGTPDDPRSVVDPECRVRGVEGLRVIDASIMPDIPRANIHLTCCMIAEHMASRLRQ
jgi:choline dehydrogenase